MNRCWFVVLVWYWCSSLGLAQNDFSDLPPRRASEDFPQGSPNRPFADDPLFPGTIPLTPRRPRTLDEGLFPEILSPSDRGPGSWPLVNSADRDDNRAPQYRVTWFPERAVKRAPSRLGFVEHLVEIPFPIILSDPHVLAGSFRMRNLNFQTDATLPDSLRNFPTNLWDISLGLAYLYKFEDGSTFGFLPRFGSPSNQPFATPTEYYLSLIAFYRTPAAYEGDYWTFGLSYFPNSQIRFPIPLLSYDYRPDDELFVRIGIPFSLTWKPIPNWKFQFDYRPLTQINSRLSYNVRDGFTLYSGFDWENQGYFLTNRPARRDLFFRDEKRLVGGVRVDIAERVTLDLSGGYAFNRRFGAGLNTLNYRYDRLDITGGGFLSAWLLIPF